MSCRFTEKISSLIDGELSAAEARAVEGHLLTCVQCEEARADFLSLRSQIVSFAATQPGAVQSAQTPLELHRYEILDSTHVSGLAALLAGVRG